MHKRLRHVGLDAPDADQDALLLERRATPHQCIAQALAARRVSVDDYLAAVQRADTRKDLRERHCREPAVVDGPRLRRMPLLLSWSAHQGTRLGYAAHAAPCQHDHKFNLTTRLARARPP